MMKAQNLIDPCVECGLSTAFGSGKFVDRIPTDDGYKCAICAGMECTLIAILHQNIVALKMMTILVMALGLYVKIA